MSNIQDVDFPRHARDTPSPFDGLPYPTLTICRHTQNEKREAHVGALLKRDGWNKTCTREKQIVGVVPENDHFNNPGFVTDKC